MVIAPLQGHRRLSKMNKKFAAILVLLTCFLSCATSSASQLIKKVRIFVKKTENCHRPLFTLIKKETSPLTGTLRDPEFIEKRIREEFYGHTEFPFAHYNERLLTLETRAAYFDKKLATLKKSISQKLDDVSYHRQHEKLKKQLAELIVVEKDFNELKNTLDSVLSAISATEECQWQCRLYKKRQEERFSVNAFFFPLIILIALFTPEPQPRRAYVVILD